MKSWVVWVYLHTLFHIVNLFLKYPHQVHQSFYATSPRFQKIFPLIDCDTHTDFLRIYDIFFPCDMQKFLSIFFILLPHYIWLRLVFRGGLRKYEKSFQDSVLTILQRLPSRNSNREFFVGFCDLSFFPFFRCSLLCRRPKDAFCTTLIFLMLSSEDSPSVTVCFLLWCHFFTPENFFLLRKIFFYSGKFLWDWYLQVELSPL